MCKESLPAANAREPRAAAESACENRRRVIIAIVYPGCALSATGIARCAHRPAVHRRELKCQETGSVCPRHLLHSSKDASSKQEARFARQSFFETPLLLRHPSSGRGSYRWIREHAVALSTRL